MVGEAGSIDRGECDPFAGQGLDRFCWCQNAMGTSVGAGRSRLGSTVYGRGLVTAGLPLVTCLDEAECKDSPFGQGSVRGRPAQRGRQGWDPAVFGLASGAVADVE